MLFLYNIYYSKSYSKNIRYRSKKSRSREYNNYLIISIIKSVERASTARARVLRHIMPLRIIGMLEVQALCGINRANFTNTHAQFYPTLN